MLFVFFFFFFVGFCYLTVPSVSCVTLSCNSVLEELVECLRPSSKGIGGWEEENLGERSEVRAKLVES